MLKIIENLHHCDDYYDYDDFYEYYDDFYDDFFFS